LTSFAGAIRRRAIQLIEGDTQDAAGAPMTFVYIVRCNFTAPGQEEAWNGWYSGPKIRQMLRNPMFLSCQRFRRLSGQGRDYLTLWTMQSPEALKTPQYLSQWGFSAWTTLIADWSRDLFDGGAARPDDFAVAPDETLRVIAFDGMADAEAQTASAALAASQPGIRWLPIAGLDRHTALIGLGVLAVGSAGERHSGSNEGAIGAVYRPISQFHVAA
jgi:hypothetical protein